MNQDQLKEVIRLHALYLQGKQDGVKADLGGANLSGADLGGADLGGADLGGADLGGADLSRADLSRANLSRANLSRANLGRANLSRADLGGANLSRANLSEAILDISVCRLDFGGWSVYVREDQTSIGCQTHPNDKWLTWEPSSPEIVAMHLLHAAEWWRVHGEAVKACIRCVMQKAKKA